MMLAVDASLAIELCLDRIGDDSRSVFAEDELVAPPLLWSEVTPVIHELTFRREISSELGDAALNALVNNTIGVRELQLSCRLVELDGRLQRGADRLGYVVTPSEVP